MKAYKLNCLICVILISRQSTHTHAQLGYPYVIPAHAQFDSSYSVFGWVLKRHVMKTISNCVGVGQCMMECSANDYCYSLNFYPNNGLCELNSATHLSHAGDYVQSVHGNFLLYFFRPATTCDDSSCASGERCFLGEDGITRQCKDCSSPLGMEDRTIPDSAIMSSSTYGLGASPIGGNNARLHNTASPSPGPPCCWAPGYLRAGEFLQVDLRKVMAVTKVATQGRDGTQIKYVSKYTITWSMDKENWQKYQENDVVKIFDGNSDQTSVVTNSLKQKLTTRHVRLVVQEWYNYIELRMELYGCPLQ